MCILSTLVEHFESIEKQKCPKLLKICIFKNTTIFSQRNILTDK